MPSLPIPVFGALVLGFLFVRMWVLNRRLNAIALLLGLCAVQTLVIALAQHYHVPGMRYVQAVLATIVPPTAWLAYQSTAVRSLRLSDLLHVLGPLTTVAALVTSPAFLDIFIPGIFIIYGAAILLQGLKGSDAQPKLSLESGNMPARIWLIIGLCLIASALSDVAIFVAQIIGASHLQPWIISIFSVGNLIVIGGLGLSGHLHGKEAEDSLEAPSAPDTEVWSRVQSYMAAKRPYLDPDLTLARLSRKLGIPAKTLSSTINRATQGNVSRYINDARIAAAQSALQAGESVTNAMFSSGFNTKSNFNREFLRVTGTSPTQWLNAQSSDAT